MCLRKIWSRRFLDSPHHLLDGFWGPKDGFFGFSSGGYRERGGGFPRGNARVSSSDLLSDQLLFWLLLLLLPLLLLLEARPTWVFYLT